MKFLDKNINGIQRTFLILSIFLGLITSVLQPQVISQNTILESPLPAQKLDIKSTKVSQVYIYTNFSATASAYSWCSGNGTITNPYIIENLMVDRYISIENTTDYFIIRNCTISSSRNYDGITLRYVRNGRLINNTIYNNSAGIRVGIYSASHNIAIINNTICHNEWTGISFAPYSSDNTITNNTICHNGWDGISFSDWSRDTLIVSNNIHDNIMSGIDMDDDSRNLTILGNNLHDNRMGIYFRESTNHTITNNTLHDNYYGILIQDSNNNTITNNIIHNNVEGIYMISYNLVYLFYEERLEETILNTITNNEIYNNSNNGINMSHSDYNIIKNNTFWNNSCGITLDSFCNDNLFYLNYFLGDWVLDWGVYNHWDNGSIGNYWSDYPGVDANNDGIGDTPYIGSFFQDNYPICSRSEQQRDLTTVIIIVVIVGIVVVVIMIIVIKTRHKEKGHWITKDGQRIFIKGKKKKSKK